MAVVFGLIVAPHQVSAQLDRFGSAVGIFQHIHLVENARVIFWCWEHFGPEELLGRRKAPVDLEVIHIGFGKIVGVLGKVYNAHGCSVGYGQLKRLSLYGAVVGQADAIVLWYIFKVNLYI